jgi:hypothetical protein
VSRVPLTAPLSRASRAAPACAFLAFTSWAGLACASCAARGTYRVLRQVRPRPAASPARRAASRQLVQAAAPCVRLVRLQQALDPRRACRAASATPRPRACLALRPPLRACCATSGATAQARALLARARSVLAARMLQPSGCPCVLCVPLELTSQGSGRGRARAASTAPLPRTRQWQAHPAARRVRCTGRARPRTARRASHAVRVPRGSVVVVPAPPASSRRAVWTASPAQRGAGATRPRRPRRTIRTTRPRRRPSRRPAAPSLRPSRPRAPASTAAAPARRCVPLMASA